MPIKHAIWKVGAQPQALATCTLASEQLLEEMIVRDLRILSSEWMLIGRQEITPFGGRIDLLAIAPDGSLVLIELKRDKTPREIVAQAIDYAAWVEGLTAEKIAQIYHRFSQGRNLDDDFRTRFGADLDEETLNQSHQIIIVAAVLDDSTERIVRYLNDKDIAINVSFFQVFKHGEDQFLSRAWMIDPGETQANVVSTAKTKGESEPWNGEFYVSYGGEFRDWEEARKYGFISAGGGLWYSQTLKLLSPGDRVWVRIPGKGYVGVGIVTQAVQSANDFKIHTPEGEIPCLQVLKHADALLPYSTDPELAEYFVGVDWLDTVAEPHSYHETGYFGSQHSVCQPKTTKWRHTVGQLKKKFPHWDEKGGLPMIAGQKAFS